MKPSSIPTGRKSKLSGGITYLENQIKFPLAAQCIASKVVSPLRKGETVAVPLSQLAAINVDESTLQAIGDWHYWLAQGYCF